jgi:hypothetical protein
MLSLDSDVIASMDDPQQLAFIDAALTQPTRFKLAAYHYGLYPSKGGSSLALL